MSFFFYDNLKIEKERRTGNEKTMVAGRGRLPDIS